LFASLLDFALQFILLTNKEEHKMTAQGLIVIDSNNLKTGDKAYILNITEAKVLTTDGMLVDSLTQAEIYALNKLLNMIDTRIAGR
jgi:hypothetical protein